MSIEYDEKGKYYTNVIQKVPVPCMVQTTTNLIRGLIHVRHDERLKDELENDESKQGLINCRRIRENGINSVRSDDITLDIFTFTY